MRVLISVERAPAADPAAYWRVTVDGQPAHHLRLLSNGFPFPVDETALDGIAEVSALWAGGIAREKGLRTAYANILDGNPGASSLQGFGRYLLETLLGEARWQALKSSCPAKEPLKLVLRWDASDFELSRLHWEMMKDASSFLAEQRKPDVTVVREVPVTGAPQARAPIDLRVLFVVGTELSDPRIRPGAEYLGMLRQLSSQQRALSHRIILAASGEELAEVVKAYQPTVLHLICHGTWDSIRLESGNASTPQEQQEGFKRWSAQALYKLLQDTGVPLPTVIVVNACDSASGPPRPIRPKEPRDSAAPASFAMELVQLGIPIVVGMAGEVADHACRLFTRRIYQSLLDCPDNQTVDLGLATADGRRAGLLLLNGHHETSDWAFPQILVRSDTDAQLKLADVMEATRREQVASRFRKRPPLCDRLESFRDFERWLDSGRCAHKVFAVVSPRIEDKPVKYGATWLLHELAAHAIYSGYIPVLVSLPDGNTEALKVRDLMKELRNEITEARRTWSPSAAQTTLELSKLLMLLANGPPGEPVHSAVKEELDVGDPTDPSVLRRALAIDLLFLAKAAGHQKVMLLLDGIHSWAPGLTTLIRMLKALLTFEGITIPVVVSCRRWPTNLQVDEQIKTFLESGFVHIHNIGKFKTPHDSLAYRQHILLRQPPYVPDPDPKASQTVENFFKKYVDGVPSRLHENPLLEGALEVLQESSVLLKVDDEAAMQNLLQLAPFTLGGSS